MIIDLLNSLSEHHKGAIFGVFLVVLVLILASKPAVNALKMAVFCLKQEK